MARSALTGKQVGGVFLSPEWIADPKRAFPYVRQVADMGYFSMIMFVRHQKRTVLDGAVHAAVKAITAQAHKVGLKALLDTDHCWWGPDYAEAHPETALWAIRSVEATVTAGAFEFRLDFPRMPGQIQFQELSAVFRPDGRGGYAPVPVRDIALTSMHYGAPRCGCLFKGTVGSMQDGRLVFYIAFRTCGVVDVAHPLYLKGQERLLDQYQDIPLDGFTWDEPGKGLGDMTCFKAGEGFMALFRKLHGYDLRTRLICLDRLDGTPEAVKVRCDYYGALGEMNYQAQAKHNQHARKRFGRGLIFGTHQTWSGFPCDLAGGVIDYFRLGRVLTAAWTDGGWDCSEPKYPVHNFMLAEGLKKELGMRDAYYNDWGMGVPAAGNMRFANRLKMLFHVNWFNHCVCEFSENLINFTQEPVKSLARQDVASLDALDRLVGDRFHPHTDVAYLYSWETLAASPKWVVRAFYTNFANLSLHLLDTGLFASVMSGEGLLSAKIVDGAFTVNGFRYRVLVVPYANVLPTAVYRRTMELADAGIPVVVVGPPPEFTTEDGALVRDDFARRAGIRALSLADFGRACAEQGGLPGVNEWEPSWMDAVAPVQVTDGRAVFDIEGRLWYTCAKDRPLYYLPAADPRENLTRLLATLTVPLVERFAEDTYCRCYTERGQASVDELVVVAVAKAHVASYGLTPDRYGAGQRPPIKTHDIKLLMRLPKGNLRLLGGTWCAVRLANGVIADVIGDCPSVEWETGRQIHP